MRERNKMVQQTSTDMEYANRKRTTRWEAFLDAISDSYAMKHFLKIDFSTEQTSDATTVITNVIFLEG